MIGQARAEADIIEVGIRVKPHRASDFRGLIASFAKTVHAWKDGNRPVFMYYEAPRECALKRLPLAQANPPQDAWEGRVFDSVADARWVRDEHGLQGWVTQEVTEEEGSPGEQTRVIRIPRRYYLIGEWDESAQRLAESAPLASGGDGKTLDRGSETGYFVEQKYPSRDQGFRYPLPAGASPQKADRAFIQVYEYTKCCPQWGNAEWQSIFIGSYAVRADSLERFLNEPRTVAHRFVEVGVGRDR